MSAHDASPNPVFIDTTAVTQVLSWEVLIPALRSAYAQPYDEKASPPRTFARGEGASLRALVSVPAGQRFMGAKVFGRGCNQGMNYLISLAEQRTGHIRALIDANKITALRTAATSALFVDAMCPPGAVRLGVLGSGSEAQAHVQAVASLRPIAALRVYSPTPANRERFARQFSEALGVPCEGVAAPQDAVAGASLVIAAARSHDESPILHARDLPEGAPIVSVGSTLPQQRELDVSVIAHCDRIVSDMPDELAAESGDLRAASAEGVIFDHKLCALNALVRGEIDPRGAARPLFKSVGSALQDVVAAELVYELATRHGLAVELPIAFAYKQ